MVDYEFRMFIENLQSNVTFLQDAAEDLYDDLDKLELENKNEIDILKILLQFVRIGQLTAAMLRTVSDGEWGVQLWNKYFEPMKEGRK